MRGSERDNIVISAVIIYILRYRQFTVLSELELIRMNTGIADYYFEIC
jgi:hypothetical protein